MEKCRIPLFPAKKIPIRHTNLLARIGNDPQSHARQAARCYRAVKAPGYRNPTIQIWICLESALRDALALQIFNIDLPERDQCTAAACTILKDPFLGNSSMKELSHGIYRRIRTGRANGQP